MQKGKVSKWDVLGYLYDASPRIYFVDLGSKYSDYKLYGGSNYMESGITLAKRQDKLTKKRVEIIYRIKQAKEIRIIFSYNIPKINKKFSYCKIFTINFITTF